jgi:hypothetical protein
MRLTKEIKQKIEVYCLNAINSDDTTFKDHKHKLQYAYNRFISEYGHEIKRYGEFNAFASWLSGLALDLDFYNCDILKLAREWGQDPKTEAQEDKIINQYWNFMTNQYFKLFKKYKINMDGV